MRYRIKLNGISPIIHHNGAAGIDEWSPINREIKEITGKRGHKTESDETRLRELETIRSLYFDEGGKITFPGSAIRATIEGAARTRKEGPKARGGMVVLDNVFDYDTEKYGVEIESLSKTTQFTVPVKVGTSRILRTRAKFDLVWSCTTNIEVDESVVGHSLLLSWLEIAGRQIGIGDWRPQTGGGPYGRFETESIDEV